MSAIKISPLCLTLKLVSYVKDISVVSGSLTCAYRPKDEFEQHFPLWLAVVSCLLVKWPNSTILHVSFLNDWTDHASSPRQETLANNASQFNLRMRCSNLFNSLHVLLYPNSRAQGDIRVQKRECTAGHIRQAHVLQQPV